MEANHWGWEWDRSEKSYDDQKWAHGVGLHLQFACRRKFFLFILLIHQLKPSHCSNKNVLDIDYYTCIEKYFLLNILNEEWMSWKTI